MQELAFQITEEENVLQEWEKYEGNVHCGYTERVWSGKEMKQMSFDVAKQLSEMGIQKGENVAVLLSNTVAYPVVLTALLYLKCNPLLLHVSTPKVEMEKISKNVPFSHFIHDFVSVTSKLDKEESNIKWNYQMGKLEVSLGVLESTSDAKGLELEGVILHLTSGTSGPSRICLRNQRVAIAEAVNYVSVVDVFNRANVMITTPMNHAFAYGFGLMAAIITNSNMFLEISFNPRKLFKEMANEKIDILLLVPPMAKLLVKLKREFKEGTMPKYVFYAGSPCSKDLKESFEEVFDTNLYAILGSTETGAIATTFTHDKPYIGVGRILNNVEVKIDNCSAYTAIGENIGDVLVKASSMMQGYYDEYTGEEIEYHAIGDIGYFDDESLVLTGRAKDIINVSGMKVDPLEVEEVLREHPEIEDVVVYSGLTKDKEEKVCAAYFSSNGKIDTEELRTFCKTRLAAYKMPRTFHYMEIPRTPSGKCPKRLLPEYNDSNSIGK